jgi:hypothetical protein
MTLTTAPACSATRLRQPKLNTRLTHLQNSRRRAVRKKASKVVILPAAVAPMAVRGDSSYVLRSRCMGRTERGANRLLVGDALNSE